VNACEKELGHREMRLPTERMHGMPEAVLAGFLSAL